MYLTVNRKIFIRSLILLSISLIYFYLFLHDHKTYYEDLVTFINVPDNLRYISYIENGFEGFLLSGVNNYSIVFIYSILTSLFSGSIEVVAFIINIFILLISYILTERFSRKNTGSFLSRRHFLVFMVLLPFILMINKDIFIVLYLLMVLVWWFSGGVLNFIIVFSLSLLKIQLVPIFLVFLFLNYAARYGSSVFILSVGFLYVFISFVSSYFGVLVFDLSNYSDVGNIAHIKFSINQSVFFLGDLLFNFLLPIQFVYDLILSIKLGDDALLVAISIFKLFFLGFILLNSRKTAKLIYYPSAFINHKLLFPYVCLLISFFLVSMISPIINYRYFLPCAPILIIMVSMFRSCSSISMARAA